MHDTDEARNLRAAELRTYATHILCCPVTWWSCQASLSLVDFLSAIAQGARSELVWDRANECLRTHEQASRLTTGVEAALAACHREAQAREIVKRVLCG